MAQPWAYLVPLFPASFDGYFYIQNGDTGIRSITLVQISLYRRRLASPEPSRLTRPGNAT